MKRDHSNLTSENVLENECPIDGQEDLRNILFLEILDTDEKINKAKSLLEKLNNLRLQFLSDKRALSCSRTSSSSLSSFNGNYDITVKRESSYNSERENLETKIRILELNRMEIFRLLDAEEEECEEDEGEEDEDEEEEEEEAAAAEATADEKDSLGNEGDERVEKEENCMVKKRRV